MTISGNGNVEKLTITKMLQFMLTLKLLIGYGAILMTMNDTNTDNELAKLLRKLPLSSYSDTWQPLQQSIYG